MRYLTVIVLLAAVAITSAPAQGSFLDPGTTQENPAVGGSVYIEGLPPNTTATQVGSTLSSPYVTSTGGIIGRVETKVFLNTFSGGSGLTFEYQFIEDPTATSELIRASLAGNWDGVTIGNVGAEENGSSHPGTVAPFWTDGDPKFILRESAGDPGFSATVFQFRESNIGTTLLPGDKSSVIWLETNATAMTTADVALEDSGATSHATVFVPVPEPSTLVLLATLVMGALCVARRRR